MGGALRGFSSDNKRNKVDLSALISNIQYKYSIEAFQNKKIYKVELEEDFEH